jgi:5'-deoxynucleotidase YfbR-like HD superfamily hydrolase
MTMREEHVLDARRAGQIPRYGVFPHVSRQTTGEHSWQVMRLLLAIWPDCPRHVLVHGLVHDVGELWAGDCSWHAKRSNKLLKAALDVSEDEAHRAMAKRWQLPGVQVLSEMDRAVFKAAETLEMLEWALHEINMGNRYAALVAQRCRATLLEMKLPEFIRTNLLAYQIKRERLEEAVADGA